MRKRYIVFMILLVLFLQVKFRFTGKGITQVEKAGRLNLQAEQWNPAIAQASNQTRLTAKIDGQEYSNKEHGIYLKDDLRMMFPDHILRDAFDCSAHRYDGQKLLIEKKNDSFTFDFNKKSYQKNDGRAHTDEALSYEQDCFYIPLDILANEMGYSCQWDVASNTMTVRSEEPTEGSRWPYRYDLREKGRAPKIKDQGAYGTCWAFAALTALESSLLPQSKMALSVDHMDQNNGFTHSAQNGGRYTMAMAYLAAWQGPVYEKDDPYGDGKTDPTLKAVKHVQEMQILEAKNLDEIKEAVFKYGGVESCIYTAMQNAEESSEDYNSKKYAYCYRGEKKPNHDIVIIGWDDNFPKERFQTELEQDGAFICQNSWGKQFGEDGVFYVSYYDTNIGIHSLVYTGIEEVDNYDRLYQSDLCGWVGQIGFNKESLYGANVFTAQSQEEVAAAGFYTTGKDTSYRIYMVPQFTGKDSLTNKTLAAEGKFTHAGYHTVRFEKPVPVEKDQKFAVVLWLSTPNAVHPMAIEYAADELTKEVDLSDGEGYVSSQGEKWADVRKSSKCNLCIKAYTNKRNE